MGKNRNKNKHRKGGGKYMNNIEKYDELKKQLNDEYYDSHSLVKIDKNIGYGSFSVILVNSGKKQNAYCRYMFTHKSPDYAIIEGKDHLQMIAPVSNRCAEQYIMKNKFEKNIYTAEDKSDKIDTFVSFYTEEELDSLDIKKTKLSNKEMYAEERKLYLKEMEEEEDDSVYLMLQVLIPKLEKKLEKYIEGLSLKSKSNVSRECMNIIDKLKSGCTRSEAKKYYSEFNMNLGEV